MDLRIGLRALEILIENIKSNLTPDHAFTEEVNIG
jgi:hypothetical protein